jgi:signal transduction histidine kinase
LQKPKELCPMPTLTTEELDHLLETLPDPTEANEPLSNLSFLQMFVPLGREQLNRLITEQTCAAGEVLFRENEPGDAMYIIRSGLVVAVKGRLQMPTFLGYRGPGEVMGEMALIENQPRSATAIVLKAGRMMRISREDFQKMMRLSPEIGMNIMREMSRRLRASDNARHSSVLDARQLINQVSMLQSEKQQLLELQRLRQETSDLIVHDLRNPLQNIMGALQLLPVVLPEEAWQANRELLEIAQSGCDRMQLLIETLLDVARIESGEMHLDLSATSLPGVVEMVTHRMTSFSRGNINLQITFPPSLPTVMVDQNLLDRVLTNLIDNAVKHTPPGGLVIVAAEVLQGEMAISVTDSGPGIPPEERERIFERFTQTTGEKRRRRGFGLGLTFCRLTVQAHGGRIWAESGENGKGSRFVFTLPLAPAEMTNV